MSTSRSFGTNTSHPVTLDLGVNRLWPGEKLGKSTGDDKDPRWGHYTHSFHPETHTIESFMDLVRKGFSFSPAMKRSHRAKSNFISAQHLVLDFDNGDETSDPATLLANDFIRKNASFLYTTPSHTPEEPRCRGVFVLSEPIYDVSEADELMGAMVAKFPTSDQSVGEASRFLYGSPEGGILIPIGNILDLKEAKKLVPPEPERRPAAPPQNQPRAPYRAPSAGMQYTVLGVIQEYAPREHRTNANPRSRYTMRCPVCTIYVEEETDAFSVSEDNDLWRCFACGQHGNARTLLRLLGGEPEQAYPKYDFQDCGNLFDQEEVNESLDEHVLQKYSNMPIGTWIITSNQVGYRSWPVHSRQYLDLKKAEFIRSLPELTEAQRNRKRHVELCWENYKKMRCKNTGETYLQRYRCGEPICPVCSIWLAEEFFATEGPDGRSKLDILKEGMDQPTIYLINLGTMRLPQDPIESESQLAKNQKDIVSMDKRLSDNLGRDWEIAASHIRGIRSKLEQDVVHYQVVLGANYERGGIEMLRRHFEKEIGLEVSIREVVCHGINDFKEKMVQLMAVRCDWETVDQYQVWRAATKNSKMIQGKGEYYKVTGTKPPKQINPKPAECKICGTCEPVDMGGVYPVATTPTKSYVSEWTGKTIVTLRQDSG